MGQLHRGPETTWFIPTQNRVQIRVASGDDRVASGANRVWTRTSVLNREPNKNVFGWEKKSSVHCEYCCFRVVVVFAVTYIPIRPDWAKKEARTSGMNRVASGPQCDCPIRMREESSWMNRRGMWMCEGGMETCWTKEN